MQGQFPKAGGVGRRCDQGAREQGQEADATMTGTFRSAACAKQFVGLHSGIVLATFRLNVAHFAAQFTP